MKFLSNFKNMKKILIIVALWTIFVHNAFAQDDFEGKITWRITIKNGGKIEYVEYRKKGNVAIDYTYMRRKMIFLKDIFYTIDYSTENKPTVMVMKLKKDTVNKDTVNKDTVLSKHRSSSSSTIGEELELVNGYNCIKIETISESSVMDNVSKTVSTEWIDTSVNMYNPTSPNGKGLVIKKIEKTETNGNKMSMKIELVEIKKCKVKNKVFSVPDSSVAQYTYIQDILKSLEDTTTSLIDTIGDSTIKSNDSVAGNEFQKIYLNKYNKELNDSTFAENIKQGISVVDFSAVWCKPCRLLSPVMEGLAKKNNKRVSFYIVNADKSTNTAKTYKIETLPTIVIFKYGIEIGRVSGYVQNIEELILEKITEAESRDKKK